MELMSARLRGTPVLTPTGSDASTTRYGVPVPGHGSSIAAAVAYTRRVCSSSRATSLSPSRESWPGRFHSMADSMISDAGFFWFSSGVTRATQSSPVSFVAVSIRHLVSRQLSSRAVYLPSYAWDPGSTTSASSPIRPTNGVIRQPPPQYSRMPRLTANPAGISTCEQTLRTFHVFQPRARDRMLSCMLFVMD